MWGLGVTMYSLAYGRMGDNAVAAVTIAMTIQDIVFVLFQGLSAATAVILGNEMGAGHLERAEEYAANFFRLLFLLSAAGMVIVLMIRGPILSIYQISPEVKEDAARCLLTFALFLPAKMYNLICIVGVLRSGGDTKDVPVPGYQRRLVHWDPPGVSGRTCVPFPDLCGLWNGHAGGGL